MQHFDASGDYDLASHTASFDGVEKYMNFSKTELLEAHRYHGGDAFIAARNLLHDLEQLDSLGPDKPYSAGEAARNNALLRQKQAAAAHRACNRSSVAATWDQPSSAFGELSVVPDCASPLSAKFPASSPCEKHFSIAKQFDHSSAAGSQRGWDHPSIAQQWQNLQQHAMPDQQLSQQQEKAYQHMTFVQQQAQQLLDQMARAATEQYATFPACAASDMTRNAYVPHAGAIMPVAAHTLHAAQQNHECQPAAHALNPIVADLPTSFVPVQQQVTQHGLSALAVSPAGHRLHTMQHRSIGSGVMPCASIAAVHTAVPKSSEPSLQQAAAMSPLGPHTPDQQAFRQFQCEDSEAKSISTGCGSPHGKGSWQDRVNSSRGTSLPKGKGTCGTKGQGKDKGSNRAGGTSKTMGGGINKRGKGKDATRSRLETVARSENALGAVTAKPKQKVAVPTPEERLQTGMQEGQIFVHFFGGNLFQALSPECVHAWEQYEQHADCRSRQHRPLGLGEAVAEARQALKDGKVFDHV